MAGKQTYEEYGNGRISTIGVDNVTVNGVVCEHPGNDSYKQLGHDQGRTPVFDG